MKVIKILRRSWIKKMINFGKEKILQIIFNLLPTQISLNFNSISFKGTSLIYHKKKYGDLVDNR